MRDGQEQGRHLRLVRGGDDEEKPLPSAPPSHPTREAGEQLALPFAADTAVMILDMSSSIATDFLPLLESTLPRWVLDVRPFPRFDLTGLNRSKAFRKFDEIRTSYCDLAGLLEVNAASDERLRPSNVCRLVSDVIVGGGKQPAGPIIVLVDGKERALEYCKEIPDRVPAPKGGWHVLVR